MTKDNWLTVAMIIAVIITAAATLLGPVLAVLVQVRASQPKPAPNANQPKNLDQSLTRQVWGTRRSRLKWLVLFIANLALYAFAIRRLKANPSPYWIGFLVNTVAALYMHFTLLIVLIIAGRFARAIDELRGPKKEQPPDDPV